MSFKVESIKDTFLACEYEVLEHGEPIPLDIPEGFYYLVPATIREEFYREVDAMFEEQLMPVKYPRRILWKTKVSK